MLQLYEPDIEIKIELEIYDGGKKQKYPLGLFTISMYLMKV